LVSAAARCRLVYPAVPAPGSKTFTLELNPEITIETWAGDKNKGGEAPVSRAPRTRRHLTSGV
jgi:hypothetical protein